MNNYIDYTNLDNKATLRDIETLCDEAQKYHFASVCVHPYYIRLVKELLNNSTVLLGSVIGYPYGLNTKEVKVYEAIDAVERGVDEIDMIINISALKNKDYDYIKEEIEEVRDAIDGKVLKVSIDANILTEDEIIKVVDILNETYVNFIKINNYSIDIINLINKHKNEVLEISVADIKNIDEIDNLISIGISRIEITKEVNLMENKNCKCHETCDCGCQEGRECTCEECNCEEEK